MDPMLEALAKVAPGTPLREAIENILRAHTGGLIVVGGEPEVDAMMGGGVRLDIPFHHGLVYELAKMDGAIILDHEVKRIRCANVELTPSPTTPTSETGMRHRTAERVARSTNALTIAVSQRRNLVSLYRGNERYLLHDLGYILTKATQALASLTRYDRMYRSAHRRLAEAEREGTVQLGLALEVLRRMAAVMQIRAEILRYVTELGREGRLIDIQLQEFPLLDNEWRAVWRDYQREAGLPIPDPPSDAQNWTVEDWLVHLDYRDDEVMILPRGYRLLMGVPRLPDSVIDRVIARYQSLATLRLASLDELDDIEGIGPQRAFAIWQELHESTPE